jgi:hypothetical protein
MGMLEWRVKQMKEAAEKGLSKITTVTTMRYEEEKYCTRYNMSCWDARRDCNCDEDCSICGNRTEKIELFVEGF